ncbi:MAG: V-type ATPase subunit [Cellulosilyticaceae bacterium]
MNPYTSYSAINAKLHARKRALVKTKDLERLIEFTSVSQMIEFFKKQYGYDKLVADFKAEEMHRTQLEVQIQRYIVLEIEKMLYYFAGPYHNFFKTMLMHYEILDLQLILRAISRGEDMCDLPTHFVHSEKYSKLSYDKLLAAKNITQFIDALKGSIYYDALKTMTQEDVTKREFHMEMKLTMLAYGEIIKCADKLSKTDRDIAKRSIGTEIDYYNVQWIYRATKYYDISPEEILIYSLPGGSTVGYSRLKKLCYCKNTDSFKKMADKFLMYPIFEETNDAFLARSIDSKLYKLVNKKDVQTIETPLSYIYILNAQLKDLIAITEGIRYQMPKEEIKKYLVNTL